MKKKLYLLLAFLLVAALIVAGVLFFVDWGQNGVSVSPPEAPVIRLADDLSVYWDRVENAESYVIKVNGNDLFSTESTSFSVMSVPGTYTIAVQAVNRAGKSACSNEVSYHTLGVTVPESELYTVLGNPVVGYGLDYSFTLELAEGCTQCEPVVKVNGQVITPDTAGNYTVSNVTEDLTVTVEGVELNAYPVTLPTGTGYKLTGEPVAYYGKDYTFTLTLDERYSRSKPVVKANGVELTAHNGSYVIEQVTKPQVITVSGVTINTYAVNLTTGRGYRISPSGVQTVSYGESVIFTVTADSPSYKITVQADGKPLSAVNGTYTVANVTSDVQVTVIVSGLPALSGVETILESTSWNAAYATPNGDSLRLSANSSLKAQYLKGLWDAGYTHLVFTANALAAADNNTNYTQGGDWTRYWANFNVNQNVDLRIDLNEFHDGDTWYDLNFNAGAMTVSNPRAYSSSETLSWTKSSTNCYFAMEDGFYVLETRGNDFGVTSPTQWLKKYVVKDDVGQRTWLAYTDYITQGDNTRSLIWGWGSPVSTMHIGQWTAINDVQIDGYIDGEVFSLHLDRAGVARYKILDWVSSRNSWNEDLALSYVDEQTIRWSAASDYKLRLATTQELIAAGYTTLKVTLTGDIGDAQIWYGEDDWSDGEICVSADSFTEGVCTFEVDLTAFKPDELFTMMANGAKFTDMTVKIEPVKLTTYRVTLPTGKGYTISGASAAAQGRSYSFTLSLQEGYTLSSPIVKVNGKMVEGTGVYTVENVQEDLNITVENIRLNTYSVTKVAGTGYTITGADRVTHGKNYTFRVTAQNPDVTVVVLVNGAVLTGKNGKYTVKKVSENLTVTVQANLPEFDSPVEFFQKENWTGSVLFADENSVKLEANPSLKAEYIKDLWEDGYTHLVFKVNASTTGNYIHGGTWDRYWGNFQVGTQDLRIDLNEFHDDDTWYDLSFINMTGPMTVSAPRLYKSPETLRWTKSSTNVYFAMEEGYYVLQTPGNDFGVTSPTQWLKKYVVKDDVGQRTWLVYTDYITQGNNTRSLVWGWGSPVSTVTEDVKGGWTWNNNVQLDGYTDGEVFSLHLDKAGTARYKVLDWVSGRNGWNEDLSLSYVDEQTIRWSAASDYKLRLATTQELIADGYTTLKVTLAGEVGDAEIWYGEDDWSDGEICISADSFTKGVCTFEVDLTAFQPDELFTMMANGAKFTDMTVKIEPVKLTTYRVTLPTGKGYTVSGGSAAAQGRSYSFTLSLLEGYTLSSPTVKVNGKVVEGTGVYTVENVQEDLNITVENVGLNTYTVTKAAGSGYTITGADRVTHGESYTFTVTAENPDTTLVVLVNGAVVTGKNGKYTVKNVSEDLTVTVQANLPEFDSPVEFFQKENWTGTVLFADENSMKIGENPSLKADYIRSLWEDGYTHLVFKVNASTTGNYIHGGTWDRYWGSFQVGAQDLRIDLNEFHDGDTWYDLSFINMTGPMTVSAPRLYKSPETLSWTKSHTNVYLAVEEGYYVLQTPGNDFGVTSPTAWLQKYVVEDDASQRTWLVYTDYITQGNNTRSVVWGWGSPVGTFEIGQWSAMNNVQLDGYTDGEVFSLVLDRAGVARFKISEFVSNRNTWGTFRFSNVGDNSITFSGAADQKLRYAATDELIAAGYTHLQVTFSGNIGESVIYFGNDEWGEGKYIIGVSKNELTADNQYTYTANVDLSRMNGNPFTLLVANAAVTDLTVSVEPVVLSTYSVTLPSGEGYTVRGDTTAVQGSSYEFAVTLNQGYTQSVPLVKVNGVEVVNVDGLYTVENVREDLNITVENIGLNTYTVTKTPGEGYTISGADTVTHGESYTFTVTAENSDATLVVLVNGTVTEEDDGSYTVAHVDGDLTITVQATMPEPAVPEDILQGNSWTGTILSSDGSSLKLAANPSLKAEYLRDLWQAGYTHLVFTVNASASGNFIHGGTWDRYWGEVKAGTQDLRIDISEFHDGNTWHGLSFINMSGDMTVRDPRAYKSPETLNWVKDNSSTYFAVEDGYYVLQTQGNDFGITSPTSWLQKYLVKDDASQRTWRMYTDYVTKGNNTRSMLWGWGSPVNTIHSNVNGGWSWNNNVTNDHDVFSLHLDRAGVARFKLLDWVSNRNEWNSALALSYVDEQTIHWSAASDYKLRLATTQDLIAQGYTTLKVTLTGNLGNAQIWYGEDDWSDGEICISADSFVDGSCTFAVDLTTFKSDELFTMMANAASFTDLQVKIQPVNKDYCSVTAPTGEGFVFAGQDTVKRGESYTFTVTPTGSETLTVSVNGVPITGIDGSYTVENVREDLVIAVTVVDQVKEILLSESWTGSILSADGSSLKLSANPSLKAQYLKNLWDAGYTHLVFTVNAKAAADNNTNFTHSGTWSRYWSNFDVNKDVELRIDLNEFHDGDTWYNLNFNAGTMRVSNPRAYKSSETLSWSKSSTNVYFAIEDGYYVLQTPGNDFGVTSPASWLQKYMVKDDASQRTWLMYTDYITKGNNTRSLIWGWGSPVNTITEDVKGGWSYLNNVQIDGYTDGEVFSLHIDRAGVARFKLLDWVSNRNGWNSALTISYVDEHTIRWSAASDYKLRLATTQDLIAAGYTTLKVTLTGDLGSAQIWYGEDDWSDGEVCISANDFVNGSCTFEVDLTSFNSNEVFTMMAHAATFSNLQVTIEPLVA
ncbi:MAG: hypothetical protein IJO28_02075 [Oscillospiraceae bacterium]|nr:hypothetical protein [Oscillospiraceae bacterium]